MSVDGNAGSPGVKGLLNSAWSWGLSGTGLLFFCAAPIFIDAYAFSTLLGGVDISDLDISATHPFPFGAGWDIYFLVISVVLAALFAIILAAPPAKARSAAVTNTTRVVTGVLFVFGLAKLALFDFPLFEVKDALLNPPPIYLANPPAADDARVMATWRRIVCSRIKVADVKLKKQDEQDPPARVPLNCGDQDIEYYRGALSQQFWIGAGLSILIVLGWAWALLNGGLASWLQVAKRKQANGFAVLVALAGVVTVINLAAVPFAYGKLLRDTNVTVTADLVHFVLMETKDKVIVFEMAAGGITGINKNAKIDGGQSERRDLLQAWFLYKFSRGSIAF